MAKKRPPAPRAEVAEYCASHGLTALQADVDRGEQEVSELAVAAIIAGYGFDPIHQWTDSLVQEKAANLAYARGRLLLALEHHQNH